MARKSFGERVADAQLDQVRKAERKALRKTPAAAEWVVIVAVGEDQMRILLGRQWELVQAPSAAGVYKDWVPQYTMRKPREALARDVEAGA